MSVYKRALRTFDTSGLTGSAQDIGAVIDFPVYKVSITNTSSVGVLISDGSSEDDIELAAGATLSIGEGRQYVNGSSVKAVFQANTQLQVTQVTGAASGKLIVIALG